MNARTFAGLHAILARWSRPAALPVPEHAGGSINDEQREAVRAVVAEALGGAYDCTRVWEAWQVGTMGPDDFVLVAEDDDRVAEIADAAIEAICPIAPPAPEASNFDPRLIALAITSEQIPPGPYSEHELQTQWDAQADEHNQWESLGSSEQLAWAQARAIAADRNGRPAAPPAPEAGEVGEVAAWLENHAAHLRKMPEIGAWPETELQEMLDRAATLLQQQQHILGLACAELNRFGAFSAAPAPAVVPVAVSERLPDPRPESEGGDCDAEGRCWWFSESHEGLDTAPVWALTWRSDDDTHWRPFHAIPLPQAGEVEA